MNDRPRPTVPISVDVTVPISIGPRGSGRFAGKKVTRNGQLTGPKAESLAAWELHRIDLDHTARVIEACSVMPAIHKGSEAADAIVYSVLCAGIFVTYCRCFDGNDARLHSLDAEAIFDEGDLTFHRHIRSVRNKFVSHDVNDARRALVTVALDADGGAMGVMRHVLSAEISPGFLDQTRRLAILAMAYVDQQIAIEEATLEAEVRMMSTEQRNSLPDAVMAPVSVNPQNNRRKGS